MLILFSWKELKNAHLGQVPDDAYIIIGPQTSAIDIDSEEMLHEEEGILLYHPMIEKDNVPLSFDVLLLDERYAWGHICIPAKYFRDIGYFNERLKAKRVYEWLLRAVQKQPVIGRRPSAGMNFMDGKEADEEAEFQADCFIASKYADKLKALGCFEEVLQGFVLQAQSSRNQMSKMRILEQLMGKSEAYWYLEDGIAPILFYHGVTYCYNILNVLAEQLEAALIRQGEQIEVYDEQLEDIEGLGRYVGSRFKAIIGVQTYLMSIYMKQSGRYLHDLIIGPKFNLVLDHPIWLREMLRNVPQNYYVLTHDENYRGFVAEYYQDVKESYLFPPGGIQTTAVSPYLSDKKYDVTFIGTYGDFREKCEVIRHCRPEVKKIALRFLHYLKTKPDWTAERSLERTLHDCQITFGKDLFVDIFFEMRAVVQAIMYYYREKTIQVLLEAGIVIEIWGTSWKKSSLAGHPCLHIHDDVTSQESIRILQESKISLNVMAWHKGGFTERMVNSMMAGAVVLTDKTTYAQFGLKNGREFVMFSLDEVKRLPKLVFELLEDDQKRHNIAKQGYDYALKYHTWDNRAKQLLAILNEIDLEGASKCQR